MEGLDLLAPPEKIPFGGSEGPDPFVSDLRETSLRDGAPTVAHDDPYADVPSHGVSFDSGAPDERERAQISFGLRQGLGVERFPFAEEKLPADDHLFRLDVQLISEAIDPVVWRKAAIFENILDPNLDAVDGGAGGRTEERGEREKSVHEAFSLYGECGRVASDAEASGILTALSAAGCGRV